MNHGQFVQVFDLLLNWDISIYWLVKKKWLSKLKIPGRHWQVKAFEPHGEFLKHELALCSECHTLLAPNSVPYLNAAEWFKEIVTEKKASQVKAIDCPPVNLGLPPGTVKKGKKDASIERERKIIKIIDEGGNPFRPDNPFQSHQFSLIDAMNNFSKSYDGFRRDYKLPYIKAWRAWLRQRSTPLFQSHWIEVREDKEDHQRYQLCMTIPGGGRGKRVFPFDPPP